MDLDPRIERTGANGADITVFGDVHREESIADHGDQIEEEMAEHDAYASEARGYEPDTLFNEFDHEIHDLMVQANDYVVDLDEQAINSFEAYALAVSGMAKEEYDAMWGPDSFYSTPYAVGTIAPLVAVGGITYEFCGAYEDVDIGAELREDWEDLRGWMRGEENGWGFEDGDLTMSRRRALRLGGVLAASGAMGWVGGAYPESLDRAGLDVPDIGSYTDMRDAFTAEGVARAAEQEDGDMMVLVGRAHVDGITRYLEDADARRGRIRLYGPILELLAEADTRMAHWVEEDGAWTRDRVVDLYPAQEI